jgi:hypothetical protein
LGNIDNLLYPQRLSRVEEALNEGAVTRENVIFTIIHRKSAERILTGNPVLYQHIDYLQRLASKNAWESIGFWHRNDYEADGIYMWNLSY